MFGTGLHAVLSYIAPCAILFVSTLTRSTLGFGDALVAMPLLALAMDLHTAAPLVALVATTVALFIFWESWQMADLQAVWRVMLASLLGIPLGLVLLQDLAEPVLQALLGGLIMTFGAYNQVSPRLQLREDRGQWAYLFGFLAGVLGGAYNTVGPLLVMYGQLRRWPPERFRATLQGCFLLAYGSIVLGHSLVGLLTAEVFTLYGLSLPAIAFAVVLGKRLNAAVRRDRFVRLVNGALILIGMVLWIRVLW